MLTTTIHWTDGTETTQTWSTLFWWEAVKKARDRYVFQRALIAQIEVSYGIMSLFFISDRMDAEEINHRLAMAEFAYRTGLADFDVQYGDASGSRR